MEEELIGAVPCSSLAVDSVLRVGTAGAIWGSCIGPYDARKRGLTGVAQASFVAKTIGKFGFQCGLVAGVFTATCCGIQRYRRQNDWVNPLIAGAVAGAAVAAGTRSWTQVVGMAGLEYIKSSRGVQLFTCRWLPANSCSPKALVFLCHVSSVALVCVVGRLVFELLSSLMEFAGYGMECSGFMRECGVRLASARYAVFGIDYEGHGRSTGSRCYIKKFENIVNDCDEFFKSVCAEKEYRYKGRFLYGESMGGAVALLLHKKEPSFYNGAVLAAPMCKISEKMKPHQVVINILTGFEDLIPKWKIVPSKDVIDSAFKDPVKREEIRNNKLIYQDKPRLKTALEMLRTSMRVTLPFLVLHGDSDTVTDPEISKALYERASSTDKTMKLYPGMWHGLTAGETDENVGIVFTDVVAWLDKYTAEGSNLVVEPLHEPFNIGIEKLPSPPPTTYKPSLGCYLCGFNETRTLHSAIF
ncbi:hypothetical protein NC652_033365 [Populus alba x Populus x berolinensis]|nr:hypothetical protein NC652_033365 [Populus alba x Populus x berolinensis]